MEVFKLKDTTITNIKTHFEPEHEDDNWDWFDEEPETITIASVLLLEFNLKQRRKPKTIKLVHFFAEEVAENIMTWILNNRHAYTNITSDEFFKALNNARSLEDFSELTATKLIKTW